MLKTEDLTKNFGGLTAVDRVSLKIKEGSILGLIGPNGAGKTTFINLLSGLLKPSEGRIFLRGKDVTGIEPHEIARMGVSRTFQISKVFKNISTLDNLIGIAYTQYEDRDFIVKKSKELLKLLELTRLEDELAGNLSGGQQKLLEIGRACVTNPEFLLLDEPFFGIHPELKKRITEFLKKISTEKKITILVVSHDVPSIMEISEDIVVMAEGSLIARGSPKEIRNNEKVIDAYLGG